jgi:cellulose synthase/poly-beta-1,6-N-acetylglucosamine synthase-like glycosyltransferase
MKETTAAASPCPPTTKPFVSVVIPCYNEERFILRVLDALANQYDWSCYEILVIDGGSTDQTRLVVEDFGSNHPSLSVHLVSNPKRHIPAALNIGIQAARGDIIVRMDAHSLPSSNYVHECVVELSKGEVAIVGMPWRIQPGSDSHMAKAIAAAVSHAFGAGDAKYRLAASGRQLVDTVPFGAFRKALWEEVGGFDENLLTNEDYDFNYRVRRNGGQILLNPSAHSDYFARATLGAVARQYARYGLWKAQMLKRHPSSIKIRQIIPPLFVLSILMLPLLGLMWAPFWWVLIAVLGGYLAIALVFSMQIAVQQKNLKLLLSLPLVFLTIHLCWGASLILGMLRSGS